MDLKLVTSQLTWLNHPLNSATAVWYHLLQLQALVELPRSLSITVLLKSQSEAQLNPSQTEVHQQTVTQNHAAVRKRLKANAGKLTVKEHGALMEISMQKDQRLRKEREELKMSEEEEARPSQHATQSIPLALVLLLLPHQLCVSPFHHCHLVPSAE